MVALDGVGIRFEFESTEIGDLLDFLFSDIRVNAGTPTLVANYLFDRAGDQWRLRQIDGEFTLLQSEPIAFALPLLNHIMRNFSDHNHRSVALHAALVSDSGGAILMPGAPGSGKSMASLWLTRLGLNYHSDEMVTINRDDLSLQALTRPITLRRTGLDHFVDSAELDMAQMQRTGLVRASELNAWITHRAINSEFTPKIPPLKAILFPVYTTGDLCQMTEISRAHAGMELMRAQFQSQHFGDHGFATIKRLVRELPVFLLVYNCFSRLENLFDQVFADC